MLSISSTYPSQKAGWLVSQSETLSDFHCVGVSGPLQSVYRPRDVIYFLSLRVCWRNPFQIRGLVVEGGLGKVLLQARHAQVSVRVSSWLSTISNFQFSIHCNTSMPNGQGRREAVQVCNQTAANDRHLSHAGEGELAIFTFTFFFALISSFSSLSCFSMGQLVFFTFTFLFYIWSIGFLIKGLSEAGPTHRCLGGEMRKRTKSDFFHWHPFFSFSSSCVPCKLHPVLGVQNWSWLLSKRSYPPGESSWSETSQVLLQIILQGGSCKSARGSWQSRPLCQVSKI